MEPLKENVGTVEFAALQEMIYRRKSTRSYTGEPVDQEMLQKIEEFCTRLKPLYPDIRAKAEIVDGGSVKCILPWTTPQMVALFCEDKKGALENVGFLYQQLDLYLQSIGLGACWLGMGKLDKKADVPRGGDGLEFAILIAFGWPKGDLLRGSAADFKRKAPGEIADKADERLEPARLAPSSVNSQPWYFVHQGDTIHAYCVLSGLFRKKQPGRMNLIDMGIALAQLYVANPETFRFFQAEEPPKLDGNTYIGSFEL